MTAEFWWLQEVKWRVERDRIAHDERMVLKEFGHVVVIWDDYREALEWCHTSAGEFGIDWVCGLSGRNCGSFAFKDMGKAALFKLLFT
jgi:hypothetical protein